MKFPTDEEMATQYHKLCEERDALYTKVLPLEDKLSKLNREIEDKRIEAEKIAAAIDTGLGGQRFLLLKKEIARIAGYLRKIPKAA